MDLSLIITGLTFIGVAQLFAKFKLGIWLAATLTVLIPFLFSLSIRLIYINGFNLPLINLVSLNDIITVTLQLMTALVIFYKLRDNEESYTSWFLLVAVGCILMVAMPRLVIAIFNF